VTLRGNWNGEGNVDWTGAARHSCPPRLSDTTQRGSFPHDRAFTVLSQPGSLSRCQGFFRSVALLR